MRRRLLPVIDAFARKALAIEVDTCLSGTRVVQVLDRLVEERGAMPQEIMLDNGPELTSQAQEIKRQAAPPLDGS